MCGGCADSIKLPKNNIVNLTIWHVYGEQSDSPMDDLIHEFNTTEGEEKGINVTTTNITSVSKLHQELIDALNGKPGAMDAPDLITCSTHEAITIGKDKFIDWKDDLTEGQIDELVEEFVDSGTVDNQLAVLPIIKSAAVIFMNGSEAEKFFSETGVKEEDLSTWDGFFDAADKYYAWSGGKSFCSVDYLANIADTYSLDIGGENLYLDDGWYDPENEQVKESWKRFTEAVSEGYISIPESFSSRDVMTGKALSGLGSSAGILYYNDTVTDSEGNSEPMNIMILPVPGAAEGKSYFTQGGVGLCALKTTSEKEKAAAVFASWLLQPENDLKLAAETGYMPANKDSFDHISDYSFESDSFRRLFAALDTMNSSYTAVSIPESPLYF